MQPLHIDHVNPPPRVAELLCYMSNSSQQKRALVASLQDYLLVQPFHWNLHAPSSLPGRSRDFISKRTLSMISFWLHYAPWSMLSSALMPDRPD